MNRFVEIAEIQIDYSTGDVGLRFGDGDVFVLPAKAAASIGRSLIDAARWNESPAVSPSHARWTN
ncbi:hypothetical protein [Mycobacterium antarcticum]|uniref:hypothetical protein n=1 Tax=Mycolicibacterium sp. TUM20984 TaxID=3023368 RepID=UPI00239C4CA0|nr:hypothetical protein [Mycolicibacterium sp. TUM20984]GLP83593.1 hypothetical protein TUM20984_50130 [Mycolicibacterium sp. TUM20984]